MLNSHKYSLDIEALKNFIKGYVGVNITSRNFVLMILNYIFDELYISQKDSDIRDSSYLPDLYNYVKNILILIDLDNNQRYYVDWCAGYLNKEIDLFVDRKDHE